MWIFKLLNAWGSLDSNLRHAMGTDYCSKARSKQILTWYRWKDDSVTWLPITLYSTASKFWNTTCILWLTANTMVLYWRCGLTKINRVKNKLVYLHSPLGKISFPGTNFTSLVRKKGRGNENLRANQGFVLTIVFFDSNLLYSLDENKVRPQDSLYWIEMVNKGSGKTDASWDFIVRHWKNIARRWRQKKTIFNPLLLFTTMYKLYNVLLYLVL